MASLSEALWNQSSRGLDNVFRARQPALVQTAARFIETNRHHRVMYAPVSQGAHTANVLSLLGLGGGVADGNA
eukprot:12324344-Alexandrium_andersonii.AAC.1